MRVVDKRFTAEVDDVLRAVAVQHDGPCGLAVSPKDSSSDAGART